MKTKTVKIPIYHGTLLIILTDDLKKVEEKYGLRDLHGFEACVFVKHTSTGYTKYMMAFKESAKLQTVAHESVHFVNALFIDRGIQLDRHNDEPQAYFTAWAFDQCYKFLNKELNKPKDEQSK